MAPEADVAIASLAAAAPSLRTRYLLVAPIAALARAGDAEATARLGALVADDPEPAVRAHAAEDAAGVGGATAALARAIDADTAPRVRQAALEAVAHAKPPLPLAAIAHRLTKDEWTFVRAAAAEALSAFPPEPTVDAALESALTDVAAPVRETVVAALAAHGDARASKVIRALAVDAHEVLEVRLAAVKALATLCDRSSVDLLAELAHRAPLPMATDEEIQIGIAAVEALGRLHPANLAPLLAPLAAKDASAEARAAAARALATAPSCR
jgi:HEAT repeat protein